MKITLLTLNVWGAPYAQHRASRMVAIGAKIRELNPDIICFQEAFLVQDRQLIQQGLAAHYDYQYYFPSGLLGSGLLTISRFPIVAAAFHRFRLGGKPEDLKRGDYYAGKGIGLTRLQTPAGLLDVYNIHPHAQYKNTPHNEYAVYTDSNLYEAAAFIHAQSPTNPVILAGDYNTQPHETGYALMTTLAQLVDTYQYLHPDSPGLTFVPENPYVKSPPQRLDYVMVRSGIHNGFDLLTADVMLTETFDNDTPAKAFSDHYAIRVEFEVVDMPAAVMTLPNGDAVQQVLAELAAKLRYHHTDTQLALDSHTEKSLIGLAALLDAGFTLRFLLRWLPGWQHLRNGLLLASLLYTSYHGIYAGVLLPTRQQTLTALLNEVELQLNQRRTFNNLTW